MKFIATAATFFAAALAVSAKPLDVWAPQILSPKSGDTWSSGSVQNVTWYVTHHLHSYQPS